MGDAGGCRASLGWSLAKHPRGDWYPPSAGWGVIIWFSIARERGKLSLPKESTRLQWEPQNCLGTS